MSLPRLLRALTSRVCSRVGLLLLLCGGGREAIAANPFVHPLFTSHMVLQRSAVDPVWGWVTPGTTVTVVVKDQNSVTVQTKTAVADSNGRWQANLDPMGLVANNAAYSAVISASGQTTATLTDVLIGDVFLCSGQSNMAFSLNTIGVYNLANEIADSANYPNIRCFTVPGVSSFTPQTTFTGGSWLASGTANTGNFSATAYFTARELYKQQGIPIGILVSAVAGTEIKAWLDPVFTAGFCDFAQLLFDQPYQGVANSGMVSTLYNGMIAPLPPFSFRAGIWYQGEYNYTQPEQYTRLLPDLMSNWRVLFSMPSLPILVVQLPNTDSYAGLRDAQLTTVKNDSNSRLITTIDIGQGMLHPQDKQDVGVRAARAALDLVYGQNVVGQGPTFSGATVSGSTIRCSFTDVSAGLMAGLKTIQTSGTQTPVQLVAGGTLSGFAVAGTNATYYTASAVIDDATKTVVVSSSSVPSPVYVRYAWTNSSGGNLYGKVLDSNSNVVDGMPASPFTNSPSYRFVVNSGAGTNYYSLGSAISITGSSLAGQAFHHWSGDTGFISGTAGPAVSATVSQVYESVLANYQVSGAPSGLTVTQPQSGQVNLTWSTMTNLHYTVKRSNVSGGPYTTLAANLTGTTSYLDTATTGNTTYYYAVSAVGLMGEGPNSAEVSVTTPAFVLNLTGTSGSAKAVLSWDPILSPVSTYNVKRSTASGGPYTTVATGLTSPAFTDQGVLSGVMYYYVVSVVDVNGEGPNSVQWSILPTFLPAPLQDGDIGSTASPGGAFAGASGVYTLAASGSEIGTSPDSFNLAWAPLTDNCVITAHISSLAGSAATPEMGVMIRATLTGDSIYARTYNAGSKSYYQGRFVTGAGTGTSVNNSLYRWVQIRRVSNSCTGWLSSDGTTWFQQGTPVTVGSTGVPVYGGLFACAASATANCTVVFDSVAFGSGTWGATTPIALQAPAAPTGVNALCVTGGSLVALSWNATAGASGYNVKRSAVSGGSYTTIASGTNALGLNTAAPANGSSYYYVISAIDAGGEGANSAEAGVTVPYTTFDAWRQPYFSAAQIAVPSIGGAAGDANGDGIENLLAYAFKMSPWANAAPSMPGPRVLNGHLAITFVRRRMPIDLIYTVEVSGDLATWNSGATFTTETSVVPLDTDSDTVTVSDNAPVSSGSRFIRVRVSSATAQ